MFKDGNTNLIYCFNESRAESIKQRLSVLGTSNDCTNLCFKNSNNKVIKGQSICVEECNIKNYLYEYNNICYESCPEGTFISSKNNYLCINNDLIEESITHIESTNIKTETTNSNEVSQYICDIKCLNCSLDSNKYKLCISCNENEGFYPRLNDSKNINSFLECYNNIEGYYLDYNIFMYKQCFPSCKKCINEGDIYNNNCSECYSNYILINTNCYQKCPYFYYFNSSNNYVCTTKYECPTDYKYLIRDKNQCIDNCTKAKLYHYEINICEEFNHINYATKDVLQECNFEYFFNNSCKINNNSYNINDLISIIKNGLINGSIDSLVSNVIEGQKELSIKNENTFYQITTSKEQNNNNKNDNISNVLLGECENILKEKYGIKEDETLLIFKIDYYQPGSSIPIIGYELFHPINKSKLNLSYCKDELINFNIPVSIDESNLFKYDPNNGYYKDECYPYTNEYGTDILINDRKNEFTENNMSLCENNCSYNGYDNITKKAKCECTFKSKELVISELINQNDLSYNFTYKEESSNIITMKCVYTLFTKIGLIKNIGSYILLFTILLFLISMILFYKCGYNLLEDDIKEIIEIKNENNIKNNLDIKETIDIGNKEKTNKKKKKKKKMKNKRKKLNLIYLKKIQ